MLRLHHRKVIVKYKKRCSDCLVKHIGKLPFSAYGSFIKNVLLYGFYKKKLLKVPAKAAPKLSL